MRLRARTSVGGWWRPEVVLAAMIGAYVVVFGWLTWLQQANFSTFDFDMGVFDQEIWLAAHHLNPFLTIRGLNMWANHVNPIIYLLVPFYWLGAGPHFLYLVQTVALASAAIPLWLLARDRLSSPWLALGIPAAWLLYPAVEWMTWWPFQPEYMAIPALVFAYWFADRNRWVWYWVCVGLVLACKEDAALPIMALGILLALRRKPRQGGLTFAVALTWFVLCVEVIIPNASNSNAPFFIYQYSELGTSVPNIFFNLFRHPSYLWDQIFTWSKVHYYLQLLVPVAGLSLLAPATLILILPTFLINVANNQGYPSQIKFQYTAFLAAGLFIALIEGLGRLRSVPAARLRAPLVGLLCAAALASNVAWSPSPLDTQAYHGGNWAFSPNATVQELAKMVRMVPAGAGVSATYAVVPHLSHRDQIYTWPNPWTRSYFGISATQPPEHTWEVQYLVLDLTQQSSQDVTLLHKLTGPSGHFRIILETDQAIIAVRKSASISH
jgi:uncharacterized membrane protein